MNKNIVLFSVLVGITGTSFAAPVSEEFVIPYFNTNFPYSTRFQVVNTTEKTIPVVITFKDIQGNEILRSNGTLLPNDMIATAILPKTFESSTWYFPVGEGQSFSNKGITFFETEGYLTVNAQGFTTPGPANPGWSTDFSNSDLKVSYSYWVNNELVKEGDAVDTVPSSPIYSLWTTNGTRSTSFVVTKPGQFDAGCVDVKYLIADRDGNSVSSNETVLGPAGQPRSKTICNDVTVFNFGIPLLSSESSHSFNEDILEINLKYNVDAKGGWVNLFYPTFNTTVRSNF